jgi:DNA-binding response OmpR family regulator
MRILVVEDDRLLSEGLVSVLSRAGHAVDHTTSGKYANTLLAQEAYDLLVLDVGLPDIDGFEVLRRLRARRSSIGVLVLTARDAVEDRVHGLDLGADDYLTKPFSVAEFEARVRALLRRNAPVEPCVSVGGLTVDTRGKRVRVNDKSGGSSPRASGCCSSLSSRAPAACSARRQIAERLIGFDESLRQRDRSARVATADEDQSAGVLTARSRLRLHAEGAHETGKPRREARRVDCAHPTLEPSTGASL